jgi:hypothetical protein
LQIFIFEFLVEIPFSSTNHLHQERFPHLARLTSSTDVTSGRFSVQLSIAIDSAISSMAEIIRNHYFVIEHSILP